MAVKPIPDGYHSVTPYLVMNGAAGAIDFYKKAFGATELFRMPYGDKIGHAEIKIGDSPIMLADENPQMGNVGPQALGGTPVTIHLHVDNADEMIRRAVEAGAKLEMEPTDQFYGERSGAIRDPFGHRWNIGHSIEEVAPDEMQRRYSELMQKA